MLGGIGLREAADARTRAAATNVADMIRRNSPEYAARAARTPPITDPIAMQRDAIAYAMIPQLQQLDVSGMGLKPYENRGCLTPRDGSGIYHRPVGTDAVTDTTIESTKYNTTSLTSNRTPTSHGRSFRRHRRDLPDGVLDNISAENSTGRHQPTVRCGGRGRFMKRPWPWAAWSRARSLASPTTPTPRFRARGRDLPTYHPSIRAS